MKTYRIRVEAGVIVEAYTILAPNEFEAQVAAFDKFKEECPTAREYAEITGIEELTGDDKGSF